MQKINLLGYTQPQLEKLMLSLGQRAYKGRQVYAWIYKVRQHDFSMMTDLTKDIRRKLDEEYTFEVFECVKELESTDGTRKFLFRLDDGSLVETVMIPDEDRATICISSQVGCALGCKFCATGTMGLKRNLEPGEIVSQLLYIRNKYGSDAFTNVVLMGMGEPLSNYKNVLSALEIITDNVGLGLAAKKVTISTSGITPKIIELANLGVKYRLALSLHAATQEKREKIVPIAKTFKLDELIEAVRYYTIKTKARVSVEYIIIKGFNHSNQDANALVKLLHGLPCKVNLLAYNPVEGLDFSRPTDEEVNDFAKLLYPRLPAVTVRKSRGTDIDAACGQLATNENKRRDGNE